jgi:hypothetical protein
MSRLAIYLTLPGGGGSSAAPPPPPPPAPPAPRQPSRAEVRAEQAATRREEDAQRRQEVLRGGVNSSIRNVGGARGRGLEVAETARALKSLTGQ